MIDKILLLEGGDPGQHVSLTTSDTLMLQSRVFSDSKPNPSRFDLVVGRKNGVQSVAQHLLSTCHISCR